MKVTLNWLKDYVAFDLPAEELAHRLTMAGLEVDAMELLGEGCDSVIVARLADVRPHPDADRLTLCTVETGTVTLQVVCGATNHRTGDLVALAQVGTELPGGFKIKKSKIRSQDSNGMLCSLSELGLAESSEGILILPPGLELGLPVFAALGLKDVRFELGLTPNRPDCLSVVGVAREVAGMAGAALRLPRPAVRESAEAAAGKTSVTILDPAFCPRYAARLIEGVAIGPSPDWLVRRLEVVGMRSINNVVDVTNFVMLELGHPLHAFDFRYLRDRRIVVRRAHDGDHFTTLDGQVRTLMASDLVICDGEGPVALAGIMGGENSEVRPDTVDILLESAYFDPLAIRRTSKRLGLHTESSHRFERGADVDMVPLALDRATELIVQLAGGVVAAGMVDCYPQPLQKRQLTISAKRTSELLGLAVSRNEIQKVLAGIGLTGTPATAPDEDLLTVAIPHFRPDLEREVDLVEEVARLVGYERIPVTMPTSALCSQPLPRHLRLEQQLADAMAELGFCEVVNYSFVPAGNFDRLALTADDPRRQTVQILNPLTEDQAVMRTTLVPSLLETAARNIAYRTCDLALFELRPVFHPCPGEELPNERLRLTALLSGRREPLGWAQDASLVDFFDVKGAVEELLARLFIGNVRWPDTAGETFYHPGKSCAVQAGDVRLGTLGEIHPGILRNYDIPQPIYLLDLDAEALFAASGAHPGFSQLSRYPDIERDSALLVDEAVTAQQIFDALAQVRLKDLERIVLFDVYRGASLPAGKKSLAIRARYRALDRTLTDEIVQGLHAKVVQALQKSLDAELR
jgi:phenylalanyl-tRNA synthetase beta chain